MSEYVHLIGAEDVSRAGFNMQHAADEMTRSANLFSEVAERLMRALDEHASRIEAAMEVKP